MNAANRILPAKAMLLPLLALALFLPCPSTHALTLSEARLHSWLHEPLNASIHLPYISAENAHGLDISLKPATEGTLPMASGIRQELAVRDGEVYVEVRSNKPIKEPYMRFILEVGTQDSVLRREYTLLINPRPSN